jgi:predicted DCC family thiol-disulfide oxidoreductase YuxK
MKPVAKAIIYDSSCPMCQAYTKGFVKWGLLADEHRIAFCELQPEQARRYLDLQRSRHEIPLVDLGGGDTLYGVDALTYLLSQRMPSIGKLMQNTLVSKAIRKFYNFISYNRRVITATASAPQGIDCAPDFRLGYRITFIIFASVLAGLITWGLGQSARHYLSGLNGLTMLLICGTGWLLQSGAAILLIKSQLRIEYLGQLAVLMLIGTLVLLPGMAMDALTGHTCTGWLLGSVVGSSILMHIEHFRRIAYLNLSQRWLAFWSVALWTTACFWLYIFAS